MPTRRMMFLAFGNKRRELVGRFRIWSTRAKPSLACSGQCVHLTSSFSMRQAHWSIEGLWTTPGRDNRNRWTEPTSLRPSTPPALATPLLVENQRWAAESSGRSSASDLHQFVARSNRLAWPSSLLTPVALAGVDRTPPLDRHHLDTAVVQQLTYIRCPRRDR